MSNKEILPSKYNMSWGFAPVIVSILLCEYLPQDAAIYIGAVTGLIYSFYTLYKKGAHIPSFILYCTTMMLVLLSITTTWVDSYHPLFMFPLMLEISAIIPMWIIFINRKRFVNHHIKESKRCCKQLFAQGAEATIVSARVILLISTLHFLAIAVTMLIHTPLNDMERHILFRILPPTVFVFSILFNQLGIQYFNRIMKHTAFLPIVNLKGAVTGKCLAVEAIQRKHDYINPVIRMAVVSHGMLYLLPRPHRCMLEKGKTDIPMECYLLFGETLQEGLNRVVQQVLPQAPQRDIQFNVMYHFENESTNRLVYLFILDLKDDSILHSKKFKGGKLWTFLQIEDNLGKHFFSNNFEYEYEHLKSIICTREKYKEF